MHGYYRAITAQIPIAIVECTAPVKILRDRLNCRTNDIAGATADLLNSQIEAAEPLTDEKKAMAVVLQTNRSLELQLDRI
jgi:uncharacterized protein